jgi:hypothetical protein
MMEEFVRRCVEIEGGLVEFPDPGLAEMIAPPPLAALLGGDEVAMLALSAEALEQHPAARPLLPGSLELDRLVQHAAGYGQVSRAWPRIERLARRNLAPEIERALTFSARRVRLPDLPADVQMAEYAQFDFIVSFVSDEKDEFLHTTVVDLWSGLPCPAAAAVLADLAVDDNGPDAGSCRRCTIEQACAVAEAELARELASRVEAHQQRVARRLSDETGRLRLYYHALATDLERRTRRAAGADGKDDPSNVGQRRAAIEAECERKMAEMAEKYRLRPSARLAAIRILTYPRLFTTVELERRQAHRTLELAFDPLLGRLLFPGCENCRRGTAFLELAADGRLLCRACSAQVSA